MDLVSPLVFAREYTRLSENGNMPRKMRLVHRDARARDGSEIGANRRGTEDRTAQWGAVRSRLIIAFRQTERSA
jgi:hypothetical protein